MPPEPFTPKRILIVTDAWRPQVNGVVRSLEAMERTLKAQGFDVRLITPDMFRTFGLPSYPEIRMAIRPGRTIKRIIESFRPDAIHISTEGTLGHAARRYCVKHGVRFSTALHTLYPDYVSARYPIPKSLVWRWLRWFHGPAVNTMAPTATMCAMLRDKGFTNAVVWSRGVDLALYGAATPDPDLAALPRPIWLNVGRVAVEKNLDAFLKLDLPGTKVIVGDGPQLNELKARYKDVVFTGAKLGAALASAYAAADVFVFPSRTDTFGLVILEALASGVPVAAYPVQGPRDVLGDAPAGVMDEDLLAACRRAQAIPPDLCRAYAQRFTWEAAARQFLTNLAIPDLEPFEVEAREAALAAPPAVKQAIIAAQ